ncbi:Ku protein [Streptomyces sp. NPDC000880]
MPVRLYAATEEHPVRLHEIHTADGSRVEHRSFCRAEGREIPYEEVGRGFALPDGRMVPLTASPWRCCTPGTECSLCRPCAGRTSCVTSTRTPGSSWSRQRPAAGSRPSLRRPRRRCTAPCNRRCLLHGAAAPRWVSRAGEHG